MKQAKASNYDALLMPGGVMNLDKLHVNEDALNFVRNFFEAGKPVAAICHGPWALINAGLVKGREMTSWPSLEVDLQNAGADWGKPADIPAFNEKMIEKFAVATAPERTNSRSEA